MKPLLLLLTLIISLNTFAQDVDKTVTLTVSGEGKTKDEAKQMALRSAIEQAFGTFISSKTEILNDELVKDEIVSISNGNIQGFEVVSEVELPKIGYAVTLKATVSVTKLTSFVESKGYEVEFKGSLFGANLSQQKLNDESELKSIIQLCEVSNEILSNSLDYSIEVSEPTIAQKWPHYTPKPNEYETTLTVKASPNNNFDKFEDYFKSTIKSIAMSASEIDNYKALKKEVYALAIEFESQKTSGRKKKSVTIIKETEDLYFRSIETANALAKFLIKSNQYIHNFEVISNIDTISIKAPKNLYENDGGNIYLGGVGYYSIGSRPEFWFLNSGAKHFNLNEISNENIRKDSMLGFPQFSLFRHSRPILSWPLYERNLLAANLDENYIVFKENKIGEISFDKNDYYSRYVAIYSEEELSKITSFSVKQKK